MSSLIETLNGPEIVLSDTLGHSIRHLVEAAKGYNTVILLYEDDFSDNILASWAELDRLNLHTRKIGQVIGGLEVHAFGMQDFPAGTVLEIHLREAAQNGHSESQRSAYKSLLNELCLISVKLYRCENGSMLLQ